VHFATCDDGALSGAELVPLAVGASNPASADDSAKQLAEARWVLADVPTGGEMNGIDVRLAMSVAERLRTGGATFILGDRCGALWRKIDDVHGEMFVDSPTQE
jgi:hypothetical protein